MKKRLSKTSINGFINYGIVIAAFLLLQLLMAQDMISNTLKSLLVPVCCYIVMAISLNLTVGILGELSLGHAGFMSLGAFSGIVAAMALPEAAPGLRLVIAILVGSIAGNDTILLIIRDNASAQALCRNLQELLLGEKGMGEKRAAGTAGQ